MGLHGLFGFGWATQSHYVCEMTEDVKRNEQQNGAGRKSRNNPTRQNAEGLSNYVFGKVQPQALPLEEAVLGALMLDREALPVVMDILRPDSFYLEAHQHVYRAVIKLFERSNPVDLLTVTEELRKAGTLEAVGGAYYLVELTNRVASAANIEFHARIIAQKHIQRELIRVSTGIIKDAYEDTTDVFDLLDDAEKGLFGITQNNLSRSYESMDTLASKVLKQIEELSGKADGLTGVPTGFTDLDRLTSGWQPSDLIILAARPGMGKTSMVLAMTLNAAKDFAKPVALFSLEMASTQLVSRLISMEAEIEGQKMRNGKLEDWEWQQLQKTVDQLSKVPVFIDDTPGINIFELRAKCRRLKMQHNIQLVIIDYLQLMTGSSEGKNTNREQEISGISRALKNMAKELSVPVIALSQLSRAVETRGGSKRPQLSDLRESGAIEQDADIVSFIYRPEYYGILEDEEGQSLKNIAEFIVAKHRHGALDTVKVKFMDKFAKFTNLDDPTFSGLDMSMAGPMTPTGTTLPSRMNDEDIPF
jgi:replicative DNA helicase